MKSVSDNRCPKNKTSRRFWTTDVTKPFDCQFSCNDGKGMISHQNITRQIMGTGVTRIPINQGGLKGTLFLPQGNKRFPAIISMYGGLVQGKWFNRSAEYSNFS